MTVYGGESWEQVISVERAHGVYLSQTKRGGASVLDAPVECLEARIGNAWSATQYRQDDGIMPGLLFSVYLMQYLVQGHCYPDGNKRLAWGCFVYILAHYGLDIDASVDAAEKFLLEIIVDKITVDSALQWVADRLIELEAESTPL